jgi:hypothetical protein
VAALSAPDAQVETLLEQGLLLLDQGHPDRSMVVTLSALALQPGSPLGHSVLGTVYERQGKRSEAIRQFELALQLNPSSVADREKLQGLLSEVTAPARRPRLTSLQLSLAAAAASGLVVFGVGLALVTQTGHKPAAALPPAGTEAQQAPSAPAPGSPVPAGAGAPAPTASTLATPTGPFASSTPPADAPAPRQPAPSAGGSASARPTPAPASKSASAPRREAVLAAVAARSQAPTGGLQPAVIGTVAPIKGEQAHASPGAEAAGPGDPRHLAGSTGEPSGPETEFIKVVPLGGAAPGASAPAPRAKANRSQGAARAAGAVPPSISISISSDPAEGTAPAETAARRAAPAKRN